MDEKNKEVVSTVYFDLASRQGSIKCNDGFFRNASPEDAARVTWDALKHLRVHLEENVCRVLLQRVAAEWASKPREELLPLLKSDKLYQRCFEHAAELPDDGGPEWTAIFFTLLVNSGDLIRRCVVEEFARHGVALRIADIGKPKVVEQFATVEMVAVPDAAADQRVH